MRVELVHLLHCRLAERFEELGPATARLGHGPERVGKVLRVELVHLLMMMMLSRMQQRVRHLLEVDVVKPHRHEKDELEEVLEIETGKRPQR